MGPDHVSNTTRLQVRAQRFTAEWTQRPSRARLARIGSRMLMTTHVPTPSVGRRLSALALVAFAGGAALSWEVLWQHHATLAIGASARGAAVTLAATMAGMAVGAILAPRMLRTRIGDLPALHIYALLEVVIGVAGLALPAAFAAVGALDVAVYRAAPALAPWVELAAIFAVIAPPTMAMGATVPVFGRMAVARDVPLSRLYGINTAGAALGTLVLAFFIIGALGIHLTIQFVACVNLFVAVLAWWMGRGDPGGNVDVPLSDAPPGAGAPRSGTIEASGAVAIAIVALTGAATFALEVAWFRAVRAAFHATTDSFALVLAAVLIALSMGARIAPALQRRGISIGSMLAVAGALILLATPVVERFDMIDLPSSTWIEMAVSRFALTMVTLGPAMVALGSVLPRLLDAASTSREHARLYATNTMAAVVGSMLAAWWWLPSFGFAATAWGVGALVGAVGVARMVGTARIGAAVVVAVSLGVAIAGFSGAGTTRALDPSAEEGQTLVAWDEGPDSTVAVVDNPRWGRVLVIDGFYATAETATAHYMRWMGHLPAILHEGPRQALVICFGTGQTANAVRKEGVERLDIVDISDAVFGMAHHFDQNEGVLEDERVHPIVMDGRAWMARTDRMYDLVTLEPMPPNHAGVNSLYSVEFYEHVQTRLNPGGTVAQWLPLHLVTPRHSSAIAAAFVEVFPNAMLWIDPVDQTGILVGRADDVPIEASWPGFDRLDERSLTRDEVEAAVILSGRSLARYAALSEPVTDDNQMLAWLTPEDRRQKRLRRLHAQNLIIIADVAHDTAAQGETE